MNKSKKSNLLARSKHRALLRYFSPMPEPAWLSGSPVVLGLVGQVGERRHRADGTRGAGIGCAVVGEAIIRASG